MELTILLDHDLEGFDIFLHAGLQETGWDQIFSIEFKRLRDYGLPANHPDHEVWRFAQQQHILLLTGNRNNDGDTSLQATLVRENTPDSLPVLTISHKESLFLHDYRQRVAHSLAAIILYPKNYRGAGRVFVP